MQALQVPMAMQQASLYRESGGAARLGSLDPFSLKKTKPVGMNIPVDPLRV